MPYAIEWPNLVTGKSPPSEAAVDRVAGASAHAMKPPLVLRLDFSQLTLIEAQHNRNGSFTMLGEVRHEQWSLCHPSKRFKTSTSARRRRGAPWRGCGVCAKGSTVHQPLSPRATRLWQAQQDQTSSKRFVDDRRGLERCRQLYSKERMRWLTYQETMKSAL